MSFHPQTTTTKTLLDRNILPFLQKEIMNAVYGLIISADRLIERF